MILRHNERTAWRKHWRLSLALLILWAGAPSCGLLQTLEGGMGRPWRAPRPVCVEGDGLTQAANSSLIPWVALSEGTGSTAVLLRARDLLFVEFAESEDAWLPYHRRDGSPLRVARDAAGVLLNGKRVVIDLSEGGQGPAWLEEAGPRDMARLRGCLLEAPNGPLRAPQREALQKIHQAGADLAWAVQGEEALLPVLSLFDPSWLMIDSTTSLGPEAVELISREKNLEYLQLGAKRIPEGAPLRFPRGLRTLVISLWDPEKNPLLLEDPGALEALTIMFSDARDLECIASLESLKELHLLSCLQLEDLSALSGNPSLRALTLTGCKGLSELAAIRDLKHLQWLGLPPSVSQARFEALLRTHRDLRVLELVQCRNIRNLEAVGSLRELESLVVLDGGVGAARLEDQQNLRFVALSEAAFEEEETLQALREAHPGALMVQAEPFCLGSGWILFLWPALITAGLAARRHSGKRRG